MPLLFDDRLAPITSELGFLETDYQSAARAFIDWQTPIQAELGVTFQKRAVQGDFESVLRQLLPLTSVQDRRFLFIPTSSSWTLYLSNGHRGADVSGSMLVLAEKIGCRSMRVAAIPETYTDESVSWHRFGATILEVYGPQSLQTWSCIRTVYVMQDGKHWEFKQWGTPFSFEEPEQYKMRRIRDRFTFDMLKRYVVALGVRAFDESFYLPSTAPSALLIEKQGPIAGNVRTFSLEEVRNPKR